MTVSLGPGETAQLACLIEVTARKPGNVHPGAAFADTSFLDFVVSAAAIAPALERAAARPLGDTILDAVERTRRFVARNTNLGLILILTPLAALGPRDGDRRGAAGGRAATARRLEAILASTTREDAERVYEAIRRARPGGLGRATEGDVADGPTGTLREMMALAAGRDLIARQYANGFHDVLADGLPALAAALARGASLEAATIGTFLALIARHGDSLIARKCGAAEAAEASRRAARVLAAGWPASSEACREVEELDRWLRAAGNHRNPGTSADLTAACLFLALREGIIPFPLAAPALPEV